VWPGAGGARGPSSRKTYPHNSTSLRSAIHSLLFTHKGPRGKKKSVCHWQPSGWSNLKPRPTRRTLTKEACMPVFAGREEEVRSPPNSRWQMKSNVCSPGAGTVTEVAPPGRGKLRLPGSGRFRGSKPPVYHDAQFSRKLRDVFFLVFALLLHMSLQFLSGIVIW